MYLPKTVLRSVMEQKGLNYKEIMVDQDFSQREIMMKKSGRTSVPQIFINDQHVGGFDELNAMNKSGKLDQLLNT